MDEFLTFTTSTGAKIWIRPSVQLVRAYRPGTAAIAIIGQEKEIVVMGGVADILNALNQAG